MAGMQPSAVMSDDRRNCVREKRLENLQRKQVESWECNCSTRQKVDNASTDDKHYFHRNLKHLSHEDHCAEKINIMKRKKAKQEKALAKNRRKTLMRREKRLAEIMVQKERARADNNTLENKDDLSDERIGIPVADMSENFMVSENELMEIPKNLLFQPSTFNLKQYLTDGLTDDPGLIDEISGEPKL